MSDNKVPLTAKDVAELYASAVKNGTLIAWARLALEWMGHAEAEIVRLCADAPPATSDPGPWPATGLEPRGCPIPGACACPPATSAELVALIEAVDTLLESAPCDCPHRMREERGEHLSHCYLFDLNVARSGAGEKR